MTKLVHGTVTSQHKVFARRLSPALELLMEPTVREVVRSPQTFAKVTEAIVDNSGFIVQTATLVRSEQRK